MAFLLIARRGGGTGGARALSLTWGVTRNLGVYGYTLGGARQRATLASDLISIKNDRGCFCSFFFFIVIIN
jgi:hypothetical protein